MPPGLAAGGRGRDAPPWSTGAAGTRAMARGPSGCGRWHETPPRPPGPRAHERRRSLTAGATSAAAAVRGQRASPRPPGLASWLYRGARMRIRLSLGRRGILQGARGPPYHEERKETKYRGKRRSVSVRGKIEEKIKKKDIIVILCFCLPCKAIL